MSESQYRFHRLPEFDYSTPGAYFITVCTNGKRNYFWESVAALTAQPLAALPPYGCGVPLAGCERLSAQAAAHALWPVCRRGHPGHPEILLSRIG